jgi:Copine
MVLLLLLYYGAFHYCSNQKYFVLLILTDGLINDMQNTVDAIVAAATLPFR